MNRVIHLQVRMFLRPDTVPRGPEYQNRVGLPRNWGRVLLADKLTKEKIMLYRLKLLAARQPQRRQHSHVSSTTNHSRTLAQVRDNCEIRDPDNSRCPATLSCSLGSGNPYKLKLTRFRHRYCLFNTGWPQSTV